MIEYDPNIIHEHAQRLYDRARAIVIFYGVGMGLLGLLGGAVLGAIDADLRGLMAAFGGAIFGLLGVAIGHARSFELRLQAQMALCQVQIELNGRVHLAGLHAGQTQPIR